MLTHLCTRAEAAWLVTQETGLTSLFPYSDRISDTPPHSSSGLSLSKPTRCLHTIHTPSISSRALRSSSLISSHWGFLALGLKKEARLRIFRLSQELWHFGSRAISASDTQQIISTPIHATSGQGASEIEWFLSPGQGTCRRLRLLRAAGRFYTLLYYDISMLL